MKILLLFLTINIFLYAQNYTLTGVIKDEIDNNPLTSANVFVELLNKGTATDNSGKFTISDLPKGTLKIKASFVGYKTKIISIDLKDDKFLEIFLERESILLGNTIIKGTIPKFRESAVAFSQLTDKDIELRLGSKEAVNILQGTPSVYISQQGGGIGEQILNLRGFDQRNIAVMINGIPINNPENGEIYWSNWAGIADLIQYVHVQRGLSAVPYSTSSIGGNVNFVTHGFSQNLHSYKIKTEFGSYNLRKSSFSFSSSLSENVSLIGLISRRTSDGYADQVFSDEFTYYISLAMIADKHTLQVNLLGSPQSHGIRFGSQKINDWSNFGKDYNPDWGYLHGKATNLRDNEFHNPTLNIKYNWQLGNDLIWSNILSLSRGSGGGITPPFFPAPPRTSAGLVNFEALWETNISNIDTNNAKQSVFALRKGVHKNYWGTLISAIKINWKKFEFNFGIDGKLYEAQNYAEVSNLLGGDYANYTFGIPNVNHPDKQLKLGDKIDYNADSFTRSYGAFVQTEYKLDKLTAYINLAISRTQYNRIDHYNYLKTDPNRETGWKNFTSTTIKSGVNYNFDSFNNVYANIGRFSRAPLSMNVYDLFTNRVFENVNNENILSFEGGYGFRNEFLKLNVNYFHTVWDDKAFSREYSVSGSNAKYYYNIFGASAKHSGVEFDGDVLITKDLRITSMFSYASNKWTNDVDASVRPESNPSANIEYHAFTKDLYVGNYPMTQASLGISYRKSLTPQFSFYINPIYNFYGRYYSDYLPESRTDVKERGIQSWRLPDFYNIDLHSGIEIIFNEAIIKTVNITINIFNVLDRQNIIQALDGSLHNSTSASVWYGNERSWSTSISIGI